MSQKGEKSSSTKDREELAGLLAAGLTLFIMVNAIDGYYDAVLRYFERRLPFELAWLSTIATYGISAGIAYKFFKIVFVTILLGSAVNTIRGGSPLATLGF